MVHYPISGRMLDEAGNVLEPRRAAVNAAAEETDVEVIAGVAGKRLRVLAVAVLAGNLETTLVFTSKGEEEATPISPVLANAAHGGFVLPFHPHGWLETAVGEGLAVTTGAGSATGILVHYVEV